MPKGYTTRQQIENYLLMTIDSSFYSQIEDWIEQVEKYIDQMTGRNFVADSTATAKLYDGNSANVMPIDDAIQITKVEQGDGGISTASSEWTEIESDEYVSYPANDLPKTEIRLFGALFSRGFQNVRVTAKWGYSASVPDDIKLASTVLVAGIINYSFNADGKVQQRTVGRYTVSYKSDKQWNDFEQIKSILEYYKKYEF